MTYTEHAWFDRKTIDIDHRGTPGDRAVFQEVILSNAYHANREDIHDKTVIDCGAHIGCFSVLAISLGAKQVIAIEPDDENRKLLEVNLARAVERSERSPQVRVIAVAIGDPHVNRQVSMRGVGENAHAVAEDGDNAVSVWSFADVLNTAEGDDELFLKVDVEGAEYAWFATATEQDMNRCAHIAGEFHGPKTSMPTSLPNEGSRVGWLLGHLLHTHSPSAFGRPKDGGMFYATRY